MQPFAAAGGDAGPPRYKAAAAPVIIGLDVEVGCVQSEVIHLDRSRHRASGGVPGDGYAMYGVATDIPCDEGRCDAHAGLLCSSEAPGWAHLAADGGDRCIAYPLVRNELSLLGQNFWDMCTAQLILTQLSTGRPYRVPLQNPVGTAEVINNDERACRSSPDGVQLTTDGTRDSVLASFSIADQPLPREHFYTLQLFNRNGSMFTQHDVEESLFTNMVAETRTVHICWSCDPNEPDTNCPTDCADADATGCAAARCSRDIEQTCESDGCTDSKLRECNPDEGRRDGKCASDLWTGKPRSLDNPRCAHDPLEEAPCAETPQWLGSEPDPTRGLPIVYVDSEQ
jgi:hypothetical protein